MGSQTKWLGVEMTTRLMISISAALCLVLPARSEPVLDRFEFSEPHMGTKFRIVLYATDEATAKKASRAAFDRVAALDAMLSDYRQSSELMQLCAKAGGPPVKVSEELFFVLAKAEATSRLSDGAFDVTVGPVVQLWRLSRRTQRLPEPEQLAKALALVGWKNVVLDPKERTVKLLKPGMLLDLGGIAKGYAGDEAHKVLKAHGITRALVAGGGDIVVSGPPPGKDGWEIAIRPLLELEGNAGPRLILHDGAVSTSGDANQHVEIDGKRYSHIVDPKTGIGLVGRMSATVVARDGTTSDSLTKIAAVLGPERGFKLIETVEGASARFIRLTELGEDVTASPRFPKLKAE
jgi:thiamine biosynthesis lipoprotein